MEKKERNLNAAAKAKKDEFYTQLTDIEKEMCHYRKHFKGKTVLCNCDDPFESNFFKYFVLNFIGASIHSGDRKFYVPDDYPLNAAGCGIDEDGRRFIRVKGIRWYTNLDIKQRHEEMVLVQRYTPEKYAHFDNYDAINIDATADIPCDYEGVMGVPITFMDKYSPDQFEIIGLGIANLGLSIGVQPYKPEHKRYRKEVQKRGAVDGDLYMVDENNNPVVPYA